MADAPFLTTSCPASNSASVTLDDSTSESTSSPAPIRALIFFISRWWMSSAASPALASRSCHDFFDSASASRTLPKAFLSKLTASVGGGLISSSSLSSAAVCLKVSFVSANILRNSSSSSPRCWPDGSLMMLTSLRRLLQYPNPRAHRNSQPWADWARLLPQPRSSAFRFRESLSRTPPGGSNQSAQSCLGVDFRTFLNKFSSFLFHAGLVRLFLSNSLFRRILPDVLCDLHRAEMRAAHGTEVRGLGAFLRKRLVVKLARGHGIEAQVELILPAELEAGLAQRVVAVLRAGMALRQVGGVRGDFVGDHAVFHVLLVRQTEVFLARHVAEHRAAVPADHRRADAAGDVVIPWCDVGGERAECVERCFVTPLELLVHVFLDQVHRDVARTLVHHLHGGRPGAFGEFALHFEFGELRLIVGVGNRAGTQAVADAEAHVVGGHDFANLVPVRVEKTFLVMGETPLGRDLRNHG